MFDIDIVFCLWYCT